MRNALLVIVAALLGVLAYVVVDDKVLEPRRAADALVAAARPHASAPHEGSWLTAESLLAKAELHHRGRADVAELRALIAKNRAAARARDEIIVIQALDACLATLEKAGFAAEALAIRADTAAPARDRHVRCMRVQLEHVHVPIDAGTAAP